MGKKHKPKQPPQLTEDEQRMAGQFDRAVRGEIPWTADEFVSVMDEYADVVDKPMDDWHLDAFPGKVAIEGMGVLKMNMTHPMNQLAAVVYRRYPDRQAAQAHLWRAVEIQSFVTKNKDLLAGRKLIELDADGKPEGLHPALLDVLCTSKMRDYRDMPKAQRESKDCFVFPLTVIDEAITKAHEMGDWTPQ